MILLTALLLIALIFGFIRSCELYLEGKLKLLNMLMPPEIVTFRGRYLGRFVGGVFLGKDGTFKLHDIWVTPDYIERNCFKSYDECNDAIIKHSGSKPEPETDEDLMMLDKNWKNVKK